MNIKAVANQILKCADFDIGALEIAYNRIKKKLQHQQVGSLSVKDLKTLLAYEYLRDGAELDFAKEILESKQTKVDLLKELDRFDY
jgi:hypothetical protein